MPDIIVVMGEVLPIYQQKEAYRNNTFTASSGQTQFSLSSIPRDGSVMAFRNGVLLGADEYSVAGSDLTLNEGFDENDILDVHFVIA